ncbi:DUF1033 family protein [Sporosarcina obsidiansis]|uniref:DUF1033 family protein n=1 Tax=Sporosarcina obsidiansis TaxID=2660748 RepID=UPI00129BE36C|nr:DUF1033 family protein [Sporosarcina obsidiansis]
MYEVIYMKADFEPWWMFEEWKDYILSTKTFPNQTEMEQYVNELILQMQQQFEYYETRKGCFHSFWSTSEKQYCEGCEGDLQIYHGIIILQHGQPNIS